MAKDHDLGLSRDIATTADEDLQHGAEGKEEKTEGHHRILTNSHKAALQSQNPNIGTLHAFVTRSEWTTWSRTMEFRGDADALRPGSVAADEGTLSSNPLARLARAE